MSIRWKINSCFNICLISGLKERQIAEYATANRFGSFFVRYQFFAMTGLIAALGIDPVYRLLAQYYRDGFLDPSQYKYAVEI